MSESGNTSEHEAIDRLFELAREGQTGDGEFERLESMVYDRFIRNYDGNQAALPGNVQVMPTEQAA